MKIQNTKLKFGPSNLDLTVTDVLTASIHHGIRLQETLIPNFVMVNYLFVYFNLISFNTTEKMGMGIPLTDEDRMPWLESLRDAIKEFLINKKGLVLGCSALKKQYREILRSGDPDYKLECYASAVNFILLDAPAEVLITRLNKRAAEGKHYMPASLLQSQLDLLNIDESEGILRVDATLSPESIVNTIKEMHPFQGCFQS